jgi:hypothetical protein
MWQTIFIFFNWRKAFLQWIFNRQPNDFRFLFIFLDSPKNLSWKKSDISKKKKNWDLKSTLIRPILLNSVSFYLIMSVTVGGNNIFRCFRWNLLAKSMAKTSNDLIIQLSIQFNYLISAKKLKSKFYDGLAGEKRRERWSMEALLNFPIALLWFWWLKKKLLLIRWFKST